MIKLAVDVEKLVRWAYDDLLKNKSSSADGIESNWPDSYIQRGGIDIGHSAAQRYPHHGLPHPDSQKIADAVEELPDCHIDWKHEGDAILAHVMGLIDITYLQEAAPGEKISSRVGWWRGGELVRQRVAPPRDVIWVRALRTSGLVASHGKKGTRPPWGSGDWRPHRVESGRGAKLATGKYLRPGRYTDGSASMVVWDYESDLESEKFVLTPLSFAQVRADYLAWWRGLKLLAERLTHLEGHAALPPKTPEMPWLEPEMPVRVLPAQAIWGHDLHVGSPLT